MRKITQHQMDKTSEIDTVVLKHLRGRHIQQRSQKSYHFYFSVLFNYRNRMYIHTTLIEHMDRTISHNILIKTATRIQ